MDHMLKKKTPFLQWSMVVAWWCSRFAMFLLVLETFTVTWHGLLRKSIVGLEDCDCCRQTQEDWRTGNLCSRWMRLDSKELLTEADVWLCFMSTVGHNSKGCSPKHKRCISEGTEKFWFLNHHCVCFKISCFKPLTWCLGELGSGYYVGVSCCGDPCSSQLEVKCFYIVLGSSGVCLHSALSGYSTMSTPVCIV